MTINPAPADTGIYKDLPLYWGFSCSYATSYDISSDMTVDASTQQNDFAGTGEFDIDLRKVFDDSDWLINQKMMFLNVSCKRYLSKTLKASLQLRHSKLKKQHQPSKSENKSTLAVS